MKNAAFFVPALALVMSGCVVGPTYKPPEAALPAKFSEAKKKPTENVPLNPWWEAFRDKQLNALVAEGMSENLSVLAALERIVEAQANVVAAGAGALPDVSASADAKINGATRTDGNKGTRSSDTKAVSTGISVSWLIDFFGQYRRAKEAASASLDAAYDDVGVSRLAYFSDLSTTYIDMRYYQQALALTRTNLASRRTTLKLINDLREGGSASKLDVVQAEGLVNQTLSQIPLLETNFLVSANHIATLLGEPAATMTETLRRNTGQPLPNRSTAAGIPADLIRNRPDIRQAERQLAAATANIGVAEAQLYPSISLNGSIDASKSWSRGASPNLVTWGFGPTLVLPIFDGHRRKAQVDIQKSVANQQYLSWKQTVLNAVEEVENAQVALNRDYRTVAALRRLVESYQEALLLARESYKAGTATALDVLDAERNVADGRLSLASAIRQVARDYVSLNVAIGGGADLGPQARPDIAAVN